MITLRILRWGTPWVSEWAWCRHTSPYPGRQREMWLEKRTVGVRKSPLSVSEGCEDGGRGWQPREYGRPWEGTGNAETDSPRASRRSEGLLTSWLQPAKPTSDFWPPGLWDINNTFVLFLVTKFLWVIFHSSDRGTLAFHSRHNDNKQQRKCDVQNTDTGLWDSRSRQGN